MRYRTIVIDPPWKVGSLKHTGRKNHMIKNMNDNYKMMSLDEIKELKIKEISDENCIIFLWTTHTFLKKAFEIIESWGFKYHCCITWDKGHGLCHCGFYRKSEFCLVAYKGKLTKCVNQKGKYIPTVLYERSRGHSKKPEILFNWIESNSNIPMVELFARSRREGWDSFGDELE